MTVILTEDQAEKALRKLAKQWPPSLGLFSWSGTLYLVQLEEGDYGHRWPDAIGPNTVGDSVPIVNDGGDPDA